MPLEVRELQIRMSYGQNQNTGQSEQNQTPNGQAPKRNKASCTPSREAAEAIDLMQNAERRRKER